MIRNGLIKKQKGIHFNLTNSLSNKSFSVCIPRLIISSLKALIGAEEYDECPQIINLLFSESRQLYKCLNTQSAPDILTLTAKASSKLLEKGKKL